MALPEDGTCYTYLMLLKQQRCAGCSRTVWIDFTHSVFQDLEAGGYVHCIMAMTSIKAEFSLNLKYNHKKNTICCTVTVYYRTTISSNPWLLKISMAPLKILCLQSLSHKLKWCVCFQHQNLDRNILPS